MRPLILCAYEIDVEPVFDAMDGARREGLGVSDSDLECPAWEAEMLDGKVPSSQRLADRMMAKGHVAMRVRSFAAGSDAGDINLVLWRGGTNLPNLVTLVDDEGRLSRGSAH